MATSSASGNKLEEHQYECLSATCKFKWPNFAGPQNCPMCNSVYVKWLTYKEDQSGD